MDDLTLFGLDQGLNRKIGCETQGIEVLCKGDLRTVGVRNQYEGARGCRRDLGILLPADTRMADLTGKAEFLDPMTSPIP